MLSMYLSGASNVNPCTHLLRRRDFILQQKHVHVLRLMSLYLLEDLWITTVNCKINIIKLINVQEYQLVILQKKNILLFPEWLR